MLGEHGFGDHRSGAAGTSESGNGHQQMQKQDGQITHRTILTTSRNPGNAPDLAIRHAQVRAAVYEGVFDDPKTMASLRTIPLPNAALELLAVWKGRARKTAAHELIFSTVSGKPISPNNVLRRWVWPACQAADLQRATWLTFRRTYSSWAHDKGVPAKVVAQIMGHTKVDTTMNVYTQVLDGAARAAADRLGSELFRVVQIPEGTTAPTH